MKKTFFLFVILFMYLTLSAQDKIITTKGDTIDCRIVSLSNNSIVYEQHADKKLVSGKTIALSDVAEYFRESTEQPFSSRKVEKPWLLSVVIGGGHMPWLLENVSEESAGNSDYKKFDDGFSLGASLHYLITKNIGFGVQYSFFTSQVKSNAFTMIEQSYPIYSNSSDRERQYINYGGISVIFRQYLDTNNKFSLNETLGGGLLLYRGESQSSVYFPYATGLTNVSTNSLATGNTIGGTLGISVEYKILPCLSVGVGGNFMYGKLSKINGQYQTSQGGSQRFTNEKLDDPLKLSRIDYSLVVRFQL